MSWIKSKSNPPAPSQISVTEHMARLKAKEAPAPRVDPETEALLAAFLVKNGRLAPPSGGRLSLDLLGTVRNHDDTVDYSVRTTVRLENGASQRFDSHIREYPDGKRRMRLLR